MVLFGIHGIVSELSLEVGFFLNFLNGHTRPVNFLAVSQSSPDREYVFQLSEKTSSNDELFRPIGDARRMNTIGLVHFKYFLPHFLICLKTGEHFLKLVPRFLQITYLNKTVRTVRIYHAPTYIPTP